MEQPMNPLAAICVIILCLILLPGLLFLAVVQKMVEKED
jgi:hypothetical protein